MTWFKVDDRFHSHPKVLALRSGAHEETAIALWLKAGSWCASNLTDGAVPSYVLDSLVRRNGTKAAAELVRVGLWEATEDGFRFRSWSEYQPSKSDVESKREKTARKVADWREKKRASDKVCNPVTPVDVTASVTLPPTRPDPSRSLTTFESDTHGTGPIVGGIEPETVRLAYVARWEQHAPGKRPPMVARGFGGAVWSEMARAFVDAETTTQILDAAFADPFVRSTGWTPNAILGAMARLSTADVRASDADKAASDHGRGTDGGTQAKSILGALRARHDEELLAAEKCALRGDADGKAQHTAEAARLRAEWKREQAQEVAS